MYTIRKANSSDAKCLAALAEKTFRDTFAAMNAPADMDLHCQDSYSEAIQAGEISSPGMITWVSEINGELIGFAQLRWHGTPDCIQAECPGEIQRLYVRNDWHGKGVAQDLMEACFDEMEVCGCDVVWLGVWEKNPRAISFYTRLGFAEVGDHVFRLGSDPQRDILMARPLAGQNR